MKFKLRRYFGVELCIFIFHKILQCNSYLNYIRLCLCLCPLQHFDCVSSLIFVFKETHANMLLAKVFIIAFGICVTFPSNSIMYYLHYVCVLQGNTNLDFNLDDFTFCVCFFELCSFLRPALKNSKILYRLILA